MHAGSALPASGATRPRPTGNDALDAYIEIVAPEIVEYQHLHRFCRISEPRRVAVHVAEDATAQRGALSGSWHPRERRSSFTYSAWRSVFVAFQQPIAMPQDQSATIRQKGTYVACGIFRLKPRGVYAESPGDVRGRAWPANRPAVLNAVINAAAGLATSLKPNLMNQEEWQFWIDRGGIFTGHRRQRRRTGWRCIPTSCLSENPRAVQGRSAIRRGISPFSFHRPGQAIDGAQVAVVKNGHHTVGADQRAAGAQGRPHGAVHRYGAFAINCASATRNRPHIFARHVVAAGIAVHRRFRCPRAHRCARRGGNARPDVERTRRRRVRGPTTSGWGAMTHPR